MKDQPHGWLFDLEDEQTPGRPGAVAVPEESRDGDAPAIGWNRRKRIRPAQPETGPRNRVIQDVDDLAFRPIQPDPLQRQSSVCSWLCFIDEVEQVVAIR